MGNIASLLGYILNYIYGLVQNYGFALIIFSVLLKLILLPLTIAQQKSAKISQELQSELNAIKFKYKNDPEGLNKATSELYKRENVKPLAGCLGGILQFVILIAVLGLVNSPLTHMKKVDKEVIEKYKMEVTENNTKRVSYPEIKIISDKGETDERVHVNMNFLGIDLTKIPMDNFSDIKVYIIPGLYIITMFFTGNQDLGKKKQEKRLTDGTSDGTSEKEDIESMTKGFKYMMPIMSVIIGVVTPLGLSLYWFVSNLLSIIERLALEKFTQKK